MAIERQKFLTAALTITTLSHYSYFSYFSELFWYFHFSSFCFLSYKLSRYLIGVRNHWKVHEKNHKECMSELSELIKQNCKQIQVLQIRSKVGYTLFW